MFNPESKYLCESLRQHDENVLTMTFQKISNLNVMLPIVLYYAIYIAYGQFCHLNLHPQTYCILQLYSRIVMNCTAYFFMSAYYSKCFFALLFKNMFSVILQLFPQQLYLYCIYLEESKRHIYSKNIQANAFIISKFKNVNAIIYAYNIAYNGIYAVIIAK